MTILYWLICFLIGIVPAYFLFRRDRKKDIPVKWLPSLLRFFTGFLTAALLLAPAFSFKKHETEKPLLIWLQDASTSMSTALKADTAAYRKDVEALLNDWRDDYTVVPVSFGGNLKQGNSFNYTEKSTNISDAIATVAEQYSDRNIGAIMLSSDGVFNEGLDPLYAPMGQGIPVFTIALGDSTMPKDLSVTRTFANKTVALNSSFEVVADIRADKLNGLSTEALLIHNGHAEGKAAIKVDKDRFTASVRFEVKATAKGYQRYTLVLPKAEGEQNESNNKRDFFVNVIDEQTKVLIWARAPHPDIAAIAASLESVPQYKVSISNNGILPEDIAGYSLIIAHQMPVGINDIPAAAKNIPVWYILGTQSNLNVFNQVQQLLKINAGGRPNDVLPQLNTSFSYFTLPASVREVLAKMPPLQAPYGTYKAAAGAQVLFRQQIGAVATDYPLWMVHTGEKAEAITAGEGIWRWRMYEYKNTKKHEVVDELIRQTVSLLSARKDNQPFKVFTDKSVASDNEAIYFYAELRNANNELINTPEAKVELKDSMGKALNYTFEKSGNSYRLNIGLLAPGSYSYKGNTQYNGKAYVSEGSFLVESVPLESLRTNADYEMMYKLAAQSGGAFFTRQTMHQITDSIRAHAQIKPVIHTQETSQPLIDKKWLFALILLFAAGEWLLRKLWSA